MWNAFDSAVDVLRYFKTMRVTAAHMDERCVERRHKGVKRALPKTQTFGGRSAVHENQVATLTQVYEALDFMDVVGAQQWAKQQPCHTKLGEVPLVAADNDGGDGDSDAGDDDGDDGDDDDGDEDHIDDD